VRALGMVSATNLVVRRRFGAPHSAKGPVVALNAHGDVVAPGEGWTHPPFGAEVADGVMYGRGVAVSKSDFATYTFALLALQSVAEHLNGAVELHFTFDEEVGGLIGPKRLLDEGIVKPDLCISAGCAYSGYSFFIDMTILTANTPIVH
jgi:acetylornithine deacetylase/succinyl-diaminopimelate desuccinylase-like protein